MRLRKDKKLKFRQPSKKAKNGFQLFKKSNKSQQVITSDLNPFLRRVGSVFLPQKHFLRKFLIFLIILSWLFSGWPQIWQNPSIPQEVQKVEAMSVKYFGSKNVNLSYTDDNSKENLIIKTDEKTYFGLTRAEVYFSVNNIGDKSEQVNFQAHFPEDKGEVNKIEKWTENIPYEADVPDYGSKTFVCEEKWQKIIAEEFKEDIDQYQCQITKEIRNCDSLDEDDKNCTLNNIQIGSHKEVKHENKWQNINLSNNSLKIKQGFFDKLLGKEIERKPIPQNFKVKKSTQIDGGETSGDLIGTGETHYFKMEINFPPSSSGEFYIEAIGDKNGYGLLDPWWSSSWNYRKKITIDHDRVGIISDMNANASSGQKTVVVKDGSLFAATETVVIKDNSNEEINTISSVSTNTLTMQNNLANTYTTASNAFVKNTTDSVNLSNFPMLVNLASDADLGANAQDDGDDIAFTASNETTQLDHEIEYFNGTAGELQAWVEIPTLLTSNDTVIYMYYGNATCSNQENVSGVWDSNYKMVQHLNDLTTSTTEDSISSSNNMTKRAANEPIETSGGKIGRAQSFDGVNDYDKTTNNFIVNPTSLTISSWIKKESGGSTYETALHKSNGTTIGASDYWLGVDISDYLTATIGANTGVGWQAGQTTTTATYGQWYFLTASWNGSVVKVYINGEYNKQYNLTSYGNLTTPTRFGASSDGANYQFKGIVDEVRVSNTSRSTDWIKTVYNNQNSSYFYTLESEVTQPNVPILQQMHYHWRNDNGSETTATSATGGTEDTTLALDEATRKRLRIEISNEGIAASTNTTYRLEYGEKSTTCESISTWTDVGAGGGDWDMSDSSNLTDGNDTTNIANNIGGTTDENTTFKTPNAAIKDTFSQTAAISLATTEYMEAEYSIIANGSAIGKNYCFRLTNAGSITNFNYSTYAEASIPKLEQIHYRWRNDDGGEGDTASWYNGSWSYRKKITIDHTKVEANHTDFPILVHIDSSETNFWSHCTSKDEIVFTQSNGTTKLKREVETFDHTADDLYVWVKIPTMNMDADLIIYLYYGNGSASETDDADTWDSNYKMVQHLNDLTTSTTEDSISSSNNMTKRAANEPIETSGGKIGRAQSFDGVNDYNKTTNNFIVNPTSLTISSWIKKESGGSNYECALHKGSTNSVGSSDYWLGVNDADYLTATIGANQSGIGWSAGLTTTLATYGQWYFLTASWNGSVVKVYINGEYNKQYNLTSYGNLTTPTRLGAANDGTTYQLKGVVDEVRVSNTSRSAEWIKTSYNNQNSPSSFYVVGGEQSGGAGATWKENQDTLTSIDKNTLIRLRLEISNEGNSTLNNTTYRIEYGAKSTTCAAISTWTALPNDDTQHWRMANSTNLTEGEATTNVANGLTDENTTFVSGQIKDTNNQTTGITLTSTQFTEIEYSIKATNNAANGVTYCFRLTNAGATTNFTYSEEKYGQITLEIANTLTVDIVDSAGNPVTSPVMAMTEKVVSVVYQVITGVFGTTNEKLRITNTTAGAQWNLTVAATSGPTSFWDSTGTDYDFNDPTASAEDGADTDSLGGQMTIDAVTNGTLTPQGGCSTTGLTLGSSAGFNEGTTDSITLLTAGATAETDCYWDLTGVDVSQTVPAAQPAAADYDIDLTLTITAV